MQWIVKGVPENIVYTSIGQINANNSLKGRTILITGGSGGIGFSIAKKCVIEGATVIICGRTESKLKAASEEIDCFYKVLDMRDVISFSSVFIDIEREVGKPIDSLVNNAGISFHEKSFFDVTEEGFDEQFSTNLKGPYFLTQEFLRYADSKNIPNVNVLFISSERGFYCDTIPYGLTKNALNSFIQGLSCRYIDKGYRFNGIAPGVTISGMTNISYSDNLYRENSYGKRVFLPEEIAETASFLLSEVSQCISGEIIPCNHGSHLKNDYK